MRNSRALLAALVAVVAAGLTITIGIDTDGPGPGQPHTITIHVDGADPGTSPDKAVTAPAAAVDAAAGTNEFDQDLSQGDTPDIPRAVDGEPLPLAAQEFAGCRTQFVRNQSARTTSPRIIVWHYTVSADRPGWTDNDALTAMANNPANGVSWHFSIGRSDGNCAFNVPLSMKAWHASAFNSLAVGIEVIATGSEGGDYTVGAGRARLVEVTREIGQRLNIPMQRGLVHCAGSTAIVDRPGIVRHVDLGACGGGHHDTDPFPDPIAQLLPELQAAEQPAITHRDRRSCRKIHAYRARPASRRRPGADGRQKRRLALVHNHQLRCAAGKPQAG